jgi:hypothetical protein
MEISGDRIEDGEQPAETGPDHAGNNWIAFCRIASP